MWKRSPFLGLAKWNCTRNSNNPQQSFFCILLKNACHNISQNKAKSCILQENRVFLIWFVCFWMCISQCMDYLWGIHEVSMEYLYSILVFCLLKTDNNSCLDNIWFLKRILCSLNNIEVIAYLRKKCVVLKTLLGGIFSCYNHLFTD